MESNGFYKREVKKFPEGTASFLSPKEKADEEYDKAQIESLSRKSTKPIKSLEKQEVSPIDVEISQLHKEFEEIKNELGKTKDIAKRDELQTKGLAIKYSIDRLSVLKNEGKKVAA